MCTAQSISWTNKSVFFITIGEEKYVAKELDVQANQFEEAYDESISLISYDSWIWSRILVNYSIQSFN